MIFDLNQYYKENLGLFNEMRDELTSLFSSIGELYSVTGRIKSYGSLKDKLTRKGLEVSTEGELLSNIGDIVGIRLIHLIGVDFLLVHDYICSLCEVGILSMCEKPSAYVYNSDDNAFYEGLGIVPSLKESRYTSVHYTVKLRGYGDLCCEIQVRSLFDEAWSELDHLVNYPEKNGNRVCRDSLKELAGLVYQSNKLADKIVREARHSTP